MNENCGKNLMKIKKKQKNKNVKIQKNITCTRDAKKERLGNYKTKFT